MLGSFSEKVPGLELPEVDCREGCPFSTPICPRAVPACEAEELAAFEAPAIAVYVGVLSCGWDRVRRRVVLEGTTWVEESNWNLSPLSGV